MEEESIINKKYLKIVLLLSAIASIIITIITRLNIDEYIKYAIVPITIILLTYTIIINTLKIRINKKNYLYLALIFIILYSYFIVPLAEVNKYLNIIVVPILTSIYVYSLTNPNFKLGISIYRWIVKLFPGYMFSNFEFIGPSLKTIKGNHKKLKEIIKGLLIAIPILVILLMLLTSADAYFKNFLSRFINIFNINITFNSVYQIAVTIVLSFLFIFSTCINIYQTRKTKELTIKKKTVSDTTLYILLGLVNTVYLLFLISEISKLTTNFLNVPVEYTYANYAREGFFQLLGVSTINFSILIFYQNFAEVINKKWINALLLTIIFFSIFIIFNSYYRMGLYIFEYGFTILRLQVILFLTMELIFFIILSFKKIKPRFSFVLLIITYLLNVYLCNEWFINYINNYFKY